MFGPTVGDKVRLADTDLIIEVEKDYTTYGDEMKFGGGKTVRDGMGQCVNITSENGALDLVITNALIVDSTGIVKADIGIKNGNIVGIVLDTGSAMRNAYANGNVLIDLLFTSEKNKDVYEFGRKYNVKFEILRYGM